MKKWGCGCLLPIISIAVVVIALSQTELGRWLFALVVVYGGMMLSVALAHDVIPGEVVSVNKLDPPTSFSAGSIRFTYEDDDGNVHEEFRRVMYSTPEFRELKIGDTVLVEVCKNDRSIVSLLEIATHDEKSCGTSVESGK